MDRPSSVPVCLQLPTLPRPPSPYNRGNQNVAEETAKFASSQHMADLKKENFSLKLKIYYLETTLTKVSGIEQFDVINENVQLKVEKEGLSKELATNKELLIKASTVVDSLSNKQDSGEGEAKLTKENDELQRLVAKVEAELLKAREDIESQAIDLEQVHTDCMLLEDQLIQKNQALKEHAVDNQYNDNVDAVIQVKLDTLQTKLDVQEHLYQTDTDSLKQELDDVRGIMIKTHEENIGNRMTIAEKEQTIRELQEQLTGTGDTGSDAGESRDSLLEMLSNYTATNARLEEELSGMETTNTDLNNVINTLNNEREKILDEIGHKEDLEQRLKDYETEIDELKQEIHELRLVDTPDYHAENTLLVSELTAAQDDVEELKHNLAQLRLSHDIATHEAAILRGTIEETEQQKHEEAHFSRSLKQNIEKLSKENSDCSKENTVLQQDNEMLRDKVQELNRDICELREDKRALMRDNNSANTGRLNELSEEILSLKQSLSDANEDLRYCKEDMKTLESDYERATEELEMVEEELKESEARRVAGTDELDELKESFLKFKIQSNDDKNKLKQQKSDIQKDVSDFRNQVAHYQNKFSELLKEKQDLESSLRKTTKEKAGLNSEVERLASEVEEVKKKGKTGDEELIAQKSYIENRIKELEETKQSLEDSVLSLKDQLSITPVPYFTLDNEQGMLADEYRLKDSMIDELKAERNHHRDERKDLEKELRRIHEMVHDLIRQLHKYNNVPHGAALQLKSNSDDFLVDSLKDAIEMVLNGVMSRDRQMSTNSSVQTTSGVMSASADFTLNSDIAGNKTVSQEDLAALQRENSLLHTDLLESRDLISALRKEMKDLIEKLNSTNLGDIQVKNMLTEINNLITSTLQPPDGLQSRDLNLTNGVTCTWSRGQGDVTHKICGVENRLKHTVQELSSTECKLTSTQSKLAVAEHKIQGLEQKLSKAPTEHNSAMLRKKVESLQLQLTNNEDLLKEKMSLVRDKNEVIDSLLDEKRAKSRQECEERSRSYPDIGYCSPKSNTSYSPTRNGTYSPTSHDLTPTTIQVSDYILVCASNWLDELPELMRALRDAVHNSLVDCKTVQTRVSERKAVWAMGEVSRLSTRLDAVYRLLQHIENLSIQQPPSRLLHSLQQEVTEKDREVQLLNDKLVKRSRDIQKLRIKLDDQDRERIKQKLFKPSIVGLNPSILSKVIDTETVLREAHRSLEQRMFAKENQKNHFS